MRSKKNKHRVGNANNWDTTTNVVKYKGQEVILRGFSLTSTEYLLRGIGMKSFVTYNWNTPSNIFSLNISELDAISELLKPQNGLIPSVRIPLNAAYYLNVVLSDWQDNASKYPNLSTQYQNVIDGIVQYFTQKGLVCILDLHWNDGVTEQQPMALKDPSNTKTGDSVAFFTAIASKYANNDLVWYELYNEPHIDEQVWLNGDATYWGMKDLYNTVRKYTNNPIVIGGAENYAYDADSLVTFEQTVHPINVLYNFHPYMGQYQAGDQTKTADGFEKIIETIKPINRPIIITETGQYCCGDSSCYLYPGEYKGVQMGYVNAILEIAKENSISWNLWAWKPNTGANCNSPDINNITQLAQPSSPICSGNNGCGANFFCLFGSYYPISK